jgi:hypothetical protein
MNEAQMRNSPHQHDQDEWRLNSRAHGETRTERSSIRLRSASAAHFPKRPGGQKSTTSQESLSARYRGSITDRKFNAHEIRIGEAASRWIAHATVADSARSISRAPFG